MIRNRSKSYPTVRQAIPGWAFRDEYDFPYDWETGKPTERKAFKGIFLTVPDRMRRRHDYNNKLFCKRCALAAITLHNLDRRFCE